ncbi:MAG: hypothetical protein IKN56_08245 [Clostridia bacterium]|nr:hypothetical protein [Clostridia bacterium]
MKKILSLTLTVCILFAFAACGAKNTAEPENTTAEEITSETETTAPEETEAVATAAEAATGEDAAEPATPDEATPDEAQEEKLPETKAEILAAYAEVMNQAKKDAPAFKKVEYQILPEEGRVVTEGKTLVNAGLNVASNFMTTKEDAEKKPEYYEKGNDMAAFPIRNTPKGCMLEDPDFLKTAKFEVLPDGNYKITLVTGTEVNPEPAAHGATTAPSKTGGIITPLSKKEIDENLEGGIVSAVFKDITYSLTFHDCESVLVYNPENNHVVSLDQTTRVSISGSGRALGATISIANQDFVNYKHLSDFKY